MNGAEKLVALLRDKGLTVSVAESCTGGLIAGAITGIPGSSIVFECGAVTYSNRMKNRLLGVSEHTLASFGAVSAQTVIEMACGVKTLSGSSLSAAVSGVAGPGGGSGDKPIGTVFIGISGLNKTRTFRFLFDGSRAEIRRATVEKTLELLINELEEN